MEGAEKEKGGESVKERGKRRGEELEGGEGQSVEEGEGSQGESVEEGVIKGEIKSWVWRVCQ